MRLPSLSKLTPIISNIELTHSENYSAINSKTRHLEINFLSLLKINGTMINWKSFSKNHYTLKKQESFEDFTELYKKKVRK